MPQQAHPWYHFIPENADDAIIKIEFVKSSDNDSHLFINCNPGEVRTTCEEAIGRRIWYFNVP
jgi:hypothetical protein